MPLPVPTVLLHDIYELTPDGLHGMGECAS